MGGVDVSMSIASDYGKERFGIRLGEEDLARLAAEYGISQPLEEMPTWLAYALLANEAERFIIAQSPRFGRTVEEAREQIAANRESMAVTLSIATGLPVDETRKRVMPEAAR